MEVLTVVGIGAGLLSGYGSHELLTAYVDERGRPYREVLTGFLSPLLGSREAADVISTFAPVLIIPIVAMAIRFPLPEVLFILFGTRDKKKLTPEQIAFLANEADCRMMHDAPPQAQIVINDLDGVHGDPDRSKTKGRDGREARAEGNGSRQPGATIRKSPPHDHVNGRHWPRAKSK